MRTLANLLAALHALGEVVLVGIVLFAPVAWSTAVVVLVGLPMLWTGGRCWLTTIERQLAGERRPSMTRRLLHWLSFGLVRRTWYWQWIVLICLLAYWAGRVIGFLWFGRGG